MALISLLPERCRSARARWRRANQSATFGAQRAWSAAHARHLAPARHPTLAVPRQPAHIEDGDSEARLALAAAAKPWRARAAEAALAGVRPNSEHFRRAAEAALVEARPSGDNAFKIELARRIAVRALALAAAGTPERVPALPASPFAPIPGGARHG